MPDVLFDYKGLRCMIEGKFADIPDAQTVVMAQAVERVEAGIAHMALAIVYPTELRETPQREVAGQLRISALQFSLCTVSRYADVAWHSGGVREVLDLMRRGHAELLEDDVVVRSVARLNAGMEGLVRILLGNRVAAEHIADHIGITDERKESETQVSDDE